MIFEPRVQSLTIVSHRYVRTNDVLGQLARARRLGEHRPSPDPRVVYQPYYFLDESEQQGWRDELARIIGIPASQVTITASESDIADEDSP